MKSFGTQLRAARQKRQMTQETLAHKAGMSSAAIRKLEADTHEPSLESLLRVTRALAASFDFALEGASFQFQGRAK